MKRLAYFLMLVPLWLYLSLDSYAEVRVHGQGITAHLERTSLAQVLMNIGQQVGIDIAVMNGADYSQAVISEVLEDVPLEQGLDRLLNGWNYALIKNSTTGAIQTLMIVSHRTEVVTTHPMTAQVQVISNRFEQDEPDQREEEPMRPDFVDEPKYLTDEDLLNDAPPEVRELILKMREQD